MSENKSAAFGIERTRKSKTPLDNLTRDVLAAQAAGMSYGNWKALHPHTGGREESEPQELAVDSNKRALVCVKCGKTFYVEPKQTNTKYCSEECRIVRTRERSRENDRKRREREKEKAKNAK